MGLRRVFWLAVTVSLTAGLSAQSSNSAPSSNAPSSSSADKKHSKVALDSDIDAGVVADGVYRNRALGMTWKIPAGWVLRTEEMNGRGEDQSSPQRTQRGTEADSGGRVLLAAFSRPPEARGEDVNASMVIAAERTAAYPGLTEAVQYLGPLEEVAKAQGFAVDEEPYEIDVGSKTLVREDFHKDVGTRVMHQATMAILSHGYAVSITVIGGTEDEVEELVDGMEFAGKAAGK